MSGSDIFMIIVFVAIACIFVYVNVILPRRNKKDKK